MQCDSSVIFVYTIFGAIMCAGKEMGCSHETFVQRITGCVVRRESGSQT